MLYAPVGEQLARLVSKSSYSAFFDLIGFLGPNSNHTWDIGAGGLNTNVLLTEAVPIQSVNETSQASTWEHVGQDPTMILSMIVHNDSDSDRASFPDSQDWRTAHRLTCLSPTNLMKWSRSPAVADPDKPGKEQIPSVKSGASSSAWPTSLVFFLLVGLLV